MDETSILRNVPRPGVAARVAIAASAALAMAAVALGGASVVAAASPAASGSLAPTGTHVPAASWHVADRRSIAVDDAQIISMSPDGTTFVAAKPAPTLDDHQTFTTLCTYDVATNAQIACADLSVLDAGLRLPDVTWSPDSSKLSFSETAFAMVRDGDLWVMDAATGALTNVADDGFSGDLRFGTQSPAPGTVTIPANPAFTPDGTGLTYSRSTLIDGTPAGNDIVTVPLSGGEPRTIVSVSPQELLDVDYGIRWAPDASRLFYSVQHNARGNPDDGIWVVNADGSDAHLLAGAAENQELGLVQVASDGRHLLILDRMNAYQFFRSPVYWVVDTSTGASTPLAPLDPQTPSDGWVSWAGFSPDGGSILTLTNVTDSATGTETKALDARARDIGATVEHQLVLDETTQAANDFSIPMTWATNGIALIPGGDHLSMATALTIEAP